MCQKTSKMGNVLKAPIQTSHLSCTLYDKISIHLIGPLPIMSQRSHHYILRIVDFATRCPEAFPVKYIDTQSICEALIQLFLRVGFPKYILSDNDPQCVAKITSE